MPEYSHIQSYVKCNKDNFAFVLSRFVSVLSKIGFNEMFLADSFYGLEWEICDNGFMYVGSNTKPLRIDLLGTSLNVRPYVMGWTPEVIKQISEPWLEISLLFETEEIITDYRTLQLKDDVKNPIWNTMVLISKHFNETGTYLTDEVTDGRPWEALLGCNNDIWSFDAAIIPPSIAPNYNKLPKNYINKKVNETIYLVNRDVWSKEPW